MFQDRQDAGRRLAEALERFRGEDSCVLALPRGGVPVALEVAEALAAPLDLVLVRKIGAPENPELALGAVVDGERPELVVNQDVAAMFRLPEHYLEREEARQLAEIERRRRIYLGDRPRVELAGRTVIIVDDGIATGATVRAAIHAVRRAGPRRVVVAVPVAPTQTVAALRREADEVVCLESHEFFYAIGLHYENFGQLSDDDVRRLLSRAPQLVAGKPPATGRPGTAAG